MWKTRSYIRSLSILLLPILAGYCFLLSKSIMLQKDNYSWKTFFYEADWSLLQGATVSMKYIQDSNGIYFHR